LVLKAVDAALPEVPAANTMEFVSRDASAETFVTKIRVAVRRADALGLIAESFLQHGIESLSGGGGRHQIIVSR